MRKEIESKKRAEDYKSFERDSSKDSTEGMNLPAPVRVSSKSSVITEPYQQQWQNADVSSLFGGKPDHKPNSTLKSNLFGDEESPQKKIESPKKKTTPDIPVPKDTLLLSPRSEKQRLEKLKEKYDQRVAQSSKASRTESDAYHPRQIDNYQEGGRQPQYQEYYQQYMVI
jgi:hypothetical protein